MQSSRTDHLSALWSRGYSRLAEEIVSLISVDAESSVLELGCGRGQFTIPLAEIIPGRIFAIDRDQKSVAELERRIVGTELENKVETLLWDAVDRIGCGTADVVVSNFVLGWLSRGDATDTLELLRGCLKSGGLIVLSDFNPVAITPAQMFAIEQGRPDNNENPSVKWWTPDEVAEVLSETGYADINVSYFDWGMKLGYSLALEQLARWNAKQKYVKSIDSKLQRAGLEVPNSFIVSGVKK